LFNRRTEDLIIRILEHDAHKFTHFAEILFRDGLSPNKNRSAGRLENAVKMSEKRAFSCAIGTYNGDAGVPAGSEVDLMECGHTVRVGVREISCFNEVHVPFQMGEK
jgi:hypothetical protein